MVISNTKPLLSSVLNILKLMVESGAEIYRVEESAKLIFKSYGFKNIDVFATTSNIIISLEREDGVINTHTKRIEKIGTDIEKIDRLNSLVRENTAKQPSVEYIENEIAQIEKTNRYPTFVNISFYGIIAGAFYFFFGGKSFLEFILSTSIGMCTGLLSVVFEKIDVNKILSKFILSFCAAFIALVFNVKGLDFGTDYIIIANIMTLIPGIGLTNSLRDLFVGDNISGVLRLIESGLSALAIACVYVAAATVILLGGAM